MPALIVEDGSVVASANTFLSLADARALAENYGVTLPVDDTQAEVSLINGMSYIGQYESSLCGTRVSIDQYLMYPRNGGSKFGFEIPNNVVPDEAKRAQLFAAVDFGEGGSGFGTTDTGKEVQSEQVDVLSQSYFQTGKTDDSYEIKRVMAELKPLFCGDTSDIQFRVSRA